MQVFSNIVFKSEKALREITIWPGSNSEKKSLSNMYINPIQKKQREKATTIAIEMLKERKQYGEQ